MTTMATVAAVWILLSACGFFVVRLALLIKLAAARTGVRFVWSGIPGYLERKYVEADPDVQSRLSWQFHMYRVLKRVLVASVAAGILALLLTALLRTPSSQ